MATFGTQVSISAQAPPAGAPQQPLTAAPQIRRLTVDEAVQLAAQNNLGIQIARVNPQLEDLNVVLARANWAPTFASTVTNAHANQPVDNLIAGGGLGSGIKSGRLQSNLGLQQNVPWGGGNYSIGWDTQRSTSTNNFSGFQPRLSSSVALSLTQPLLRGYAIDATRQQLQVSEKNREIADVQLRQSLASTTRTVRNSYWDLAYAIAFLQVQQQTLDLAQESLRNTRARVEIGTTPPIDIVEAEAEVATREEGVILATAQIETAQDTLRALVFDPNMPDFWTLRIEPSDVALFRPTVIDIDAAVRNALDRRTDLQQSKKSLEATDVNIRYLRNQTLPEVTADLDYGLTGLGGTQLRRAPGVGLQPGDVIGTSTVGLGSVLGDVFGNQFPSWTAALTIRYPIGTSPQEASLARNRLQYSQTQTQIRNQQLQVVTQVREAARQAQTNQKRVDTTRVSRELAERRLDAEQRKFAAGTSTNFLVFQAQRDLAQARNNELRATLDYQRSVVDLDTVQEVPLNGGGGVTATAATASGATTTPGR
jgi:outer membrane protein TolC